MLWNKLSGAGGTGGVPLEFVGGTALNAGLSTTPSYSLTGLTGGIAASPSAGDIVIASIMFRDNTDRNITCSGYTEVADIHRTRSGLLNSGCNFAAFYKVLSAADTTVTFNVGPSNQATSCAIHVWRNQNSTPLDATTTTADGVLNDPNAPSITTVTSGAIVIAIGAIVSSNDTLIDLTAPSGMTNFFTISNLSRRAIGIASILRASAGSYDPPAFGGGNTSNSTFCAATLAIRPS